jgi:phosphoacetylglucosamine mutase
MSLLNKADLRQLSSKYQKPPNYQPHYGTAGFRARAGLLESTLFRCGVLAGLRAHKTKKCIGLMVTASHNPDTDNGVKMVEPDGAIWVPAAQAANTEITSNDERNFQVRCSFPNGKNMLQT